LKKQFLLLFLVVLFSGTAYAQSLAPITIREVDGSPSVRSPRTIVVPNGSLTVTDKTATLTFSGGGGTGADPSASVGLSAVNGVATTFLRSDGAPALSQSIAPTWTGLHVFTPTVTTGNGLAVTGTPTSGNLVSISASGTGAASNTKTALSVATSGANTTGSMTTYGGIISNTSTGTSSTNIALQLAASGASATNGNVALSVTTGQVNLPTGTASAPALSVGAVGSGLYSASGGFIGFVTSANLVAGMHGTAGWTIYNGKVLGFDAGNGAGDVILRRNAAAHLTFGATDAASPVGYTLSFQGATGTDTAGATATIRGSLGTSVGAPGRIHLTGGALISATGTTTQTAVDRLVVGATKVLTNNSATTVTNATVAANTSAAGVIDYAIEVTDGTDYQYEVGSVAFGATNKGGAFSGNTATKFGNHQNATAGTLTVTWAISAANPGVISVNANSSLTPSTNYPRVTYTVRNLSQNAISIQ